jgi:outer membrane protein assembly factor BamD (BamD/ComL family)
MGRVKAVFALLLMGLAALAGGVVEAHAEKRVALIIGNSNYTSFAKLENATNDSESLRDALTSINFDVVLSENVTLDGFADGLANFLEKARDADVAVVYYAGHAVQHDGQNYLIPVNGRAQDLDELDFRSEPVDQVVKALQLSKGVRILILDACRNNPTQGRDVAFRSIGDDPVHPAGLAAPKLDSRYGMFVAYATVPDGVAEDGTGGHSPYNVALVKWIASPELTIDSIFHKVAKDVLDATHGRQHPNTFNSMATDYVLNPSGSEWVDWGKIKSLSDITDPDLLQRFIAAHPDSAHIPDVKHRIEILQQNLAETDWEKVKDSQDLPAWRRFVDAHPDSNHAPQAKDKIRLLQKIRDEAAEKEWNRIAGSSDPSAFTKFKERFPDSPYAGEAAQRVEAALEQQRSDQIAEKEWDRIKDSSDFGALQEFRNRNPNSSHAAEADKRIADLQRTNDDRQRRSAWEQLKTSSDRARLERFRDRYPDSPEAAEADKKIEALLADAAWNRVKGASDPETLQDFRDRYPNSSHDAEALQAIAKAQTRNEEKRWDEVNKSDLLGLQRFLDQYPNSPHAAEVGKHIAALQQEQARARERQNEPKEQTLDDTAAWDHAKDSTDRAELEAFKHFFPYSSHVADADRRIADLDKSIGEQQRKQAEAEKAQKAKQAEEACRQEAADVAEFAKARSIGALDALRGRAACAKTIAAVDLALREIKTQDCAAGRDRVSKLGDLEALRSAVTGLTCDAAVADARTKIDRLEQDAARAEKACAEAQKAVDGIDPAEAGAHERLEKYQAGSICAPAQKTAKEKIDKVEDLVRNVQTELARLHCYMEKPASGRYDKSTQQAIARIRVAAPEGRLTRELLNALKDRGEADACPPANFAVLPPPAPPSHPPALSPPTQPPTQDEICKRDGERLARLRGNPSAEEAQHFATELSCEQLRPQLLRLTESLGFAAPAPVPSPSGNPFASDSSPPGPRLTGDCAAEQDALHHLRAEPTDEAVRRFWRDLRCESLRPQVRMLMDSLNVSPETPASSASAADGKRPVLDATRSGTRGISGTTASESTDPGACKREAEELDLIRANPDRSHAESFARTVTCDALKPQAARLLKSFAE